MSNYLVFSKIFKILTYREKIYSFFMAFLMIIAMLFEMLSIGSFLPLIGSLIDENYTSNFFSNLGFEGFNFSFNQMLIILLILFFIKNLYLVFFNIIQTAFINIVSLRVMNSIYSYYLKQSYEFHLNKNSALLIRNINESGVIDSVLLRVLTLINDVIIVFGLIILLILAQPLFTVYTIISVVLIIFIYNFFTKKKIKVWGKQRFDSNFFLTKNLYEGINAFKEIILNNSSNFFISKNFRIKKKLLNINFKFKIIEFLPKYIIEILGIVIIISLIYFLLKINDEPKNIIPILALYTASAFKIIPSLLKIFSTFQNFNYLNPSLDNIYSQLNDYNDLVTTSSNNKISKKIDFHKKIEIKNLFFKFSEKKILFNNFNILIEKNSFIGVKGDSGTGKSTLLNMLSGLIKPQKGEILVDGVNIFENIQEWRDKLGYVSQSVFLIDESIKKNIAFGIEDNDINYTKLDKAIQNSGLSNYIDSLEDKENTIVGERGIRISGGQKQRIGLARALYFSPEVLILDEATNSLDKETEKNILKQLLKIKDKITLIIVSHENEPLKIADKIYDLNEKLN
tara:strand:- start:1005 stop:2708 length:1704 start_codon:yes stop_codon:yes gene_type:complete